MKDLNSADEAIFELQTISSSKCETMIFAPDKAEACLTRLGFRYAGSTLWNTHYWFSRKKIVTLTSDGKATVYDRRIKK